jgi:hypothetical protein
MFEMKSYNQYLKKQEEQLSGIIDSKDDGINKEHEKRNHGLNHILAVTALGVGVIVSIYTGAGEFEKEQKIREKAKFFDI